MCFDRRCVLPEDATMHFYRSILSQLCGLYIFAFLVYVIINMVAPKTASKHHTGFLCPRRVYSWQKNLVPGELGFQPF